MIIEIYGYLFVSLISKLTGTLYNVAHRRASHPYGRVLLSVGNIHTKYGVSDARRAELWPFEFKNLKNYYHEIPSIYSSSECGLQVGES
jgi:hypothetical protein